MDNLLSIINVGVGTAFQEEKGNAMLVRAVALNVDGLRIVGQLYLPLTVLSDYSDVVTIANVIDRSYSGAYETIEAGQALALRLP